MLRQVRALWSLSPLGLQRYGLPKGLNPDGNAVFEFPATPAVAQRLIDVYDAELEATGEEGRAVGLVKRYLGAVSFATAFAAENERLGLRTYFFGPDDVAHELPVVASLASDEERSVPVTALIGGNSWRLTQMLEDRHGLDMDTVIRCGATLVHALQANAGMAWEGVTAAGKSSDPGGN